MPFIITPGYAEIQILKHSVTVKLKWRVHDPEEIQPKVKVDIDKIYRWSML